MGKQFSVRRSDGRDISFWLVFDAGGGVRLVRGEPDCARSERAMSMSVKVPHALFETFDEAFLANIVTPDGQTIAQWAVPQIERAYVEGKMPTQLMIGGPA